MTMSREFSATLRGNTILLQGSLAGPGSRYGWCKLEQLVEDGTLRGIREFEVRSELQTGHYPDVDVALAAIFDAIRERGVILNVADPDSRQLQDMSSPPHLLAGSPPPRSEYFSRVWRFTEENASDLSDQLSENAMEMASFANGTFRLFRVLLWEAMDNVLQHARRSYGFIEVQVHQRSGIVSCAVSDSGIGIRGSFLGTRHAPRTDEDAITLAAEREVSSKEEKARGNGLWMMRRAATAGIGGLRILSGRAEGNWPPYQPYPTLLPIYRPRQFSSPMTVLSFDLGTTRDVDLLEILGYDPVVLETETFQRSSGGGSEVSIRDEARGTGSRRAAEQLRNKVMTLHQENGPPTVLDFANVDVISLSFADEFVGRLFEQFGPLRFSQELQIKGVNPLVQSLLDRAMRDRLGGTR